MKQITIVAIALLMANLSFGQADIGLKIGYTNSGLTNSLDTEFATSKRISGLHFGVIGQIGLSENTAIVVEVDFQQRGVEQEITIGMAASKTKSVINYLEVPLLFRFSKGGETKVFGNVGPFIGYALGGKIKGESTLNGETTAADGKIKFEDEPDNYMGDDFYAKDVYNRIDIGIYIGAGIIREFGIGSFILDARFGIGFTDYNDTDNIYPNGKPDDYKSNRFNDIIVSVGYLFPLGS
ncbi:MAG: porin family protein [Saprospiraceae bacterium]